MSSIVHGLLKQETISGNVATRIDRTDESVIYIGIADVGTGDNEPLWMIKRLEIGNEIIKKYAPPTNGNLYSNIWNNRLDLEYI